MNRLGMMIDLSHVSHNVMRSVLAITKAPIIFSHSSVYEICKNHRNVPDDVLRLVVIILDLNKSQFNISCVIKKKFLCRKQIMG